MTKLKRRRGRRIYIIGQEIIPAKSCLGFVHIARKDYVDVLGDKIKKGDKIIRFNNWAMGNEVISFAPYVRDHDDGEGVILGVKYGKARGRWGVIKNAVICDRFFASDLKDIGDGEEYSNECF